MMYDVMIRYGVDDPSLHKIWELFLPKILHQRVHFWLQPPMIQEPLYSRTYDLTDYDSIAQAYDLIYEVNAFIHSYFQYARQHKDMSEPLIYDFVDITRQMYQNTFSEVLRVFSRSLKECTPFVNKYKKYENTDSCGGDIKHQDCYDDQGNTRPCTVDELKDACNEYFDCSGFNSNGWIKSFAQSGFNITGTDLYLRETEFVGNVCEKP